MPKGGLGNLIALPLQGRALKDGNSAFIDENSNAVQKTKLQTKVEENGSETDYAKEYDVTEYLHMPGA